MFDDDVFPIRIPQFPKPLQESGKKCLLLLSGPAGNITYPGDFVGMLPPCEISVQKTVSSRQRRRTS